MDANVGPASNGICRRVFPGLEACAVDEIVRRLPIVVDCNEAGFARAGAAVDVPSSQSPIVECWAASKRGTSSSAKIVHGETAEAPSAPRPAVPRLVSVSISSTTNVHSLPDPCRRRSAAKNFGVYNLEQLHDGIPPRSCVLGDRGRRRCSFRA